MTVAIRRKDYTSRQLRYYSGYAYTVAAARRMLALANVVIRVGMRRVRPVWIVRRCVTGCIVIMPKAFRDYIIARAVASKVSPRPQHPRSDRSDQETLKKVAVPDNR